MTVSPANVGVVKVNGVNYTPNCGYNAGQVLSLQAVATNSLYKLGSWGGALSGSTNPINLTMDASKTVSATFVLTSQAVTLQGAKALLNGSRDVLVLDVSDAVQFAASHLLCAKNYVWSSSAQTFTPSTAGLNAYKTMDILVYDQTGAKSKSAADNLAAQGFTKVNYMTDGLDDWDERTFTKGEDDEGCTSLGPLAYAGADQAVNENQNVTLNGSGSSAGMISWEQKEGASVTLSNPAAANPTFTAPDLNGPSDPLVFHLTVTDAGGKKDTDSVTVTVSWNNAPPDAEAGPPQTVQYGDTVQLDGRDSSDPENNISYQWTVSGSQINPVPALVNPTTATPSFMAPDKSGFIIYALTVMDNGGLTDTDTVKITVQEGTVVPNNPPTANAGPDQAMVEKTTITLDGSGSDMDGTIGYQWTQTAGPAGTFSNAAAAGSNFTAPSVAAAQQLTLTLTVTDDDGATATDNVVITVNDDGIVPANQQPTANAGSDQSVKSGAMVVLDGTGSSDQDGSIAGYAWTQTDATGITVTLSSASASKPSFAAPEVENATTFVFSLIVTDDKGLASAANTVSVTVTKSSGGGGGGGGCFISSIAD